MSAACVGVADRTGDTGAAPSLPLSETGDHMPDADARALRPADLAIAGLIAALVPAIYLAGASGMGLWEPWETTLATLGWRGVTDTAVHVLVPLVDGEPVARPWLQSVLLDLGFRLGGGTELGLRAPFAVLTGLCVAAAYLLLRLLVGRGRAALVAGLFVTTPAVALSSMTLAGGGHSVGPFALALTLLLAAASRPEHRRILVPLLGAAIGLCFWAAGTVGAAIPLTALAFAALGERDPNAAPAHRASLIGGIAAAVVAALAAFGLVLSAAPAHAAGIAARVVGGWSAWGPVAGFLLVVVAPLAALLGALPGSRLAPAFVSRAGLAGLALAVIIVLPGIAAVRAALAALGDPTSADILALTFGSQHLTARVLPAHTTFDVVIRLAAFSAYPLVALAPLGFGWALRSAERDVHIDTDDTDAVALAKRALVLWMAVSFAAFGLSASSNHLLLYAVVLPIPVVIGLALTDRAYLAYLYRNRAAWYAIGIATLLLLAMLSKDVRGYFNPEMGRPGPQVIFEALLLDGSVEFPKAYVFGDIKIFFALWVLALLAYFARPVDAIRELALDTARAADAASGRFRWSAPRRVAGLVASLASRVADVAAALLARSDALLRGRDRSTAATAFLIAVFGAWGLQLAAVDVRSMTHHIAQAGLLESFERFAPADAPLYAVGIGRGDSSYYLREGAVERLDRLSELRELFCADGRTFAVIEAADLGEAYYHVRRELPAAAAEGSGDAAEPACPPQQLYVLDARSSRYLLVSDELRPEAGETQQSYIAENVFSDETLPDSVTLATTRYVMDERIELVGWEASPPVIDRGEVIIDAYWRVLDTPRSGYKVFIHVDYRGNRINGDHDVVGGRFEMQHWIPGEIVRDRYTVEVGRADRAGTYQVLYGFFRGDDRLRAEPAIGDNRVPLGQLEVRR